MLFLLCLFWLRFFKWAPPPLHQKQIIFLKDSPSGRMETLKTLLCSSLWWKCWHWPEQETHPWNENIRETKALVDAVLQFPAKWGEENSGKKITTLFVALLDLLWFLQIIHTHEDLGGPAFAPFKIHLTFTGVCIFLILVHIELL